ncbi:YdcH family protein [Oceanibaculum pacificum]|uniref:YdcH family protein n=1 Tax=Oceanibaculum pacificum TaxID=580166 RepID=UPI000A06D7F1|nr:YdcH family protein [Oceanibaculum pacificum]
MATPDSRVEALKARHEALEHALQSETIRPSPDDLAILSLKKEKLRLKDEITKLTRH